MDSYTAARQRMVRDQIEARGMRDHRVCAAMLDVPRHLFAGTSDAAAAYDDRPLPIGSGQTISQPYMVALMTEALQVRQGARVLEVGTGSGYQAAVLSQLAASVITVERHAALAAQAAERLSTLGCGNVRVLVGDGTRGWPDGAPYDGILVAAGAPAVPDALRRQLADGGRLVIPVGNAHLQHLTVVVRDGGSFTQRVSIPCSFVPLVGEEGWPD